MKHACVLLLVGLVACTRDPSSDPTTSDSDLKDTDQNDIENLVSTVGSNVSIELFPAGGPVGSCPHTVLWITYEDVNGYFASEKSLNVYYRVPSGNEKTSATIPMTVLDEVGIEHPTFEAFVCFPHADLPGVDVAFANSAKTKWDSANSKNYSVVFPAQRTNPAAGFHTAFGNDVGLTINLMTSSNENCGASPALELAYEDKTHFFGNASAISMWIKFHTHDGDTTHTVLLSNDRGAYRSARFCLDDDEANATTLEMAFSDLAKHTWDSNNSQNYFANPVSPP